VNRDLKFPHDSGMPPFPPTPRIIYLDKSTPFN
jgi:hypothetical protein